MRKWHHLQALIRLNGSLAAAAYLMVVVVRLALWCMPFRYVHRFFKRLSVRQTPGADTHGRRRRIAAAISIVSHFMPKASCLTQALAAQALLRLKGESAQLHFGVTRDAKGCFKAHAWLESDGHLLIGDLPELGSFRPMRRQTETTTTK